ncbi:hypothetical protein [Amycolatopsis anabasis]|uniref:hypothetical protein n=1 Tax=Amycolatopsis anabasis TaxID=1840409 RepID=UPI00131D4913|nr:hypothetical protein [Amycolatopsis anabasis]
MPDDLCPRCGWPLAELPSSTRSVHPVSSGRVSYRRCVCGSWLLQLNGRIAGATRSVLEPQDG